jgi:hypothetical protein
MLRQSMLATRTRAAGPSRLYAPGAISHRTPLRRTYTSSSSPSSKVTVVPFAQSPEQARERLLIHGLLGSGTYEITWVAFRRHERHGRQGTRNYTH